jgi:hypothetical protein
MQLSSVTFVLAEAILRELRTKVTHHPVARYLGNHAGGRDAQTNAVPIDDGSLRKWKRNDRQSVNQHVIRRVHQGRDRQTHCSMARAQDVDAINFNGIDNGDRPSDFGIGHQFRINFLAQFRRKLFGIVQATMTKFFGENYRSCHNRTCERATSSFINTCDPPDTDGAKFFLVTKSAPPAHAEYYAEILMMRSEM